MRDTEHRKYFWPAVYQEEINAVIPMPAGAMVKNTIFSTDLETYNAIVQVTPSDPSKFDESYVGTYVLDPRAIPVAARYRTVHNAPIGSNTGEVFNRLVITNEGLAVWPIRSLSGAWVEPHEFPTSPPTGNYYENNDSANFVITAFDLSYAFKDCDGERIKMFNDAEEADRLVTCAILQRKLDDALSIVQMMFDQFKRQIDSLYDARGATTELVQGAADAGLDQSQDQVIPFTVTVGVIAPYGTGTENEKLQVPKFLSKKSALSEGTIYAVDVFHGDDTNKVYQGTYYRRATGPGWFNSKGDNVVFVLDELAAPGFLGGPVSGRNFVFRSLRSGESATNVKDMHPGYTAGLV